MLVGLHVMSVVNRKGWVDPVILLYKETNAMCPLAQTLNNKLYFLLDQAEMGQASNRGASGLRQVGSLSGFSTSWPGSVTVTASRSSEGAEPRMLPNGRPLTGARAGRGAAEGIIGQERAREW